MVHVPAIDPPADLELAMPFWDAVERDEIVLSRCSACHRVQWYPDSTGPDCAGAAYEWTPVALTGTVHTMTRVHRAFLPGAVKATPFVVGFIELDGVDGARLVANIADEADVRIGDRVEARYTSTNGRRRPVFHPIGA